MLSVVHAQEHASASTTRHEAIRARGPNATAFLQRASPGAYWQDGEASTSLETMEIPVLTVLVWKSQLTRLQLQKRPGVSSSSLEVAAISRPRRRQRSHLQSSRGQLRFVRQRAPLQPRPMPASTQVWLSRCCFGLRVDVLANLFACTAGVLKGWCCRPFCDRLKISIDPEGVAQLCSQEKQEGSWTSHGLRAFPGWNMACCQVLRPRRLAVDIVVAAELQKTASTSIHLNKLSALPSEILPGLAELDVLLSRSGWRCKTRRFVD